jgi:hypothetical protein
MKSPSILSMLVLCAAAMTSAVGCSNPNPVARDVTVSLDPSLRDADGKLRSVQVDMIAVPQTELNNWTSVPVDTYWTPASGGLYNSADKKTLTFSFQENATSKTVHAKDPVWDKWIARSPSHLVVIARGAGSSGGGGGAGSADPRRLVIPLDPNKWERPGSPLEVDASTAGLRLKTPLKTK